MADIKSVAAIEKNSVENIALACSVLASNCDYMYAIGLELTKNVQSFFSDVGIYLSKELLLSLSKAMSWTGIFGS